MKFLKFLLTALIILVPCSVAVLIYNDKITENAPRYYRQGVEFYEKGDYSNAYYNFAKISQISPLYDISLYKQAKSAQQAGDFKTAAIKYKQYLEKEPKSIFAQTAKFNSAKSNYYAKQYEDAAALFEELAKLDSSRGNESVYFAGLTAKQLGDREKSVQYLKKYIQNALGENPKHKSYLQSAADELAASGIANKEEDYMLLGKAYYKTGAYRKAAEYFDKIDSEEVIPWVVLTNHYSGNKVKAKKLIEAGLITFAKSTSTENLKNIYNIYTSYKPGSKFKSWSDMLAVVRENMLPCEDYILYKIAETLPEDKALSYYKEIAENYPKSDYAPEALWKVFFNEYLAGNWQKAEETAVKHSQIYSKSKTAPRMLYWTAKTFEKEGKTAEANSYYSLLVSKYADNYYGLRADSVLKKSNFWLTNPSNMLPSKYEMPEFPIMISDINMADLKVLNTIFEAGDYEIWLDADYNSPIVESWFEQKNGNRARSILLARDESEKMDVKPPFVSPIYKLVYPRYWNEEINSAAKENGLDAYFVTALIREESYFNPKAKSVTFASGLMQLMPDTADFMLKKLGKDLSSVESIEDPETNIVLGCAYIKYLKEKFDNDLFVTAAYNGGEGAVQKWQNRFGTEDLDVFIERIPFDETRNYVKKVFRSYHMYKKIYR